MQCRESCDVPPCWVDGGGKNPKERAMHLRDQCQGINGVMEGLENRSRGAKNDGDQIPDGTAY